MQLKAFKTPPSLQQPSDLLVNLSQPIYTAKRYPKPNKNLTNYDYGLKYQELVRNYNNKFVGFPAAGQNCPNTSAIS